MAQSTSQDYLAALQAQVASLRRKLVVERSEQERFSRTAKRAESEAEALRAEARDFDEDLSAGRARLKERLAQAASDRWSVEAYRREVTDRKLQIAAFRAELEQTKVDAAKEVVKCIARGTEEIEEHENRRLQEIASCSAVLQAEAQASEEEVRRWRNSVAADLEEVARQLGRSAGVQLLACVDSCRHQRELDAEQRLAEEAPAETEREHEEQRRLRDQRLNDVAKEGRRWRKETQARREKEQAKRTRKRRGLVTSITNAKRRAEQQEREAEEHEAEVEKQRLANVRAAAEQSVALVPGRAESAMSKSGSLVQPLARQPSVLRPMMQANARTFAGKKANGLYAEFPLVGALKGLDQEIRLAASEPRTRLPPV